MLRDSAIYMLVVGLLAAILADGVVTWLEAFTLVVLYFVYFVLMLTHEKIKAAAGKFLTSKTFFSCKYKFA